jgi:hypothetical protein
MIDEAALRSVRRRLLGRGRGLGGGQRGGDGERAELGAQLVGVEAGAGGGPVTGQNSR